MLSVQEAKDKAALEWWREQNVTTIDGYPYEALSNGVKAGNIKQRHLEDVLEHAMIIYAYERSKVKPRT